MIAALLLAAAAARGEAPPDVVVLSLTAQRRDRIGAYGHPGGLTPALDALAAESAVFTRAAAPIHWTLPAQATMLTGLYPPAHGVIARDPALPEEATTLPEVLRLYDYRAAAFTGGLDTDAGFGLAQGFEVYDDDTGGAPLGDLAASIERALAWAGAQGDAPILLWLQSYEAHDPYCRGRPPAEPGAPLAGRSLPRSLLKALDTAALSPADRASIEDCYDEGVRRNDAGVAALRAGLAALGRGDAILVVTAEHGESLGEHGSYDRFGAADLHEPVVGVPLMIRAPGVRPMVVDAPASLADLAPTILELAGAPAHWQMQGRSLAPLLRGEAPDGGPQRALFSVTGGGGWAGRLGDRKLVVDGGGRALYDLAADPGAPRALAAAHPEQVLSLSRAYAAFSREAGRGAVGARAIEIDPALKQALEDAGYW